MRLLPFNTAAPRAITDPPVSGFVTLRVQPASGAGRPVCLSRSFVRRSTSEADVDVFTQLLTEAPPPPPLSY